MSSLKSNRCASGMSLKCSTDVSGTLTRPDSGTGLPSLRAPKCPGPGWSHHSASRMAMTETGGTTTFIPDTNLLERLFLEERRRTKIIPHAFGERPVLKLMYAAVIRAADRWRGLTVGEFEQRQLRAIRNELDRAHAERTRPTVRHIPSASPSKLSNQART